MMLFHVEYSMEKFATPEAKRAFLSGLYYAASRIQGYSAELYFQNSHHTEVPAERLRTLAEDLMKLGNEALKEAQTMEKAEEDARKAEFKSMTSPPPVESEKDKLVRTLGLDPARGAPTPLREEDFPDDDVAPPTEDQKECFICEKIRPPPDREVCLMHGNGGAYGCAPAHQSCIEEAVERVPDREVRGWYPKDAPAGSE